MLDSFIIGCNSGNVDLRLNSLEVLTVLIGQTDVWLQVQENIHKLLECLINISVDCANNSEFEEPIVLGIKNLINANQPLAKITFESIKNAKKKNLINLIAKTDSELAAQLQDPPKTIPKAESNKVKPEVHDSKIETQNNDFINIWEENDFFKQSDTQKSRSLT